MWTEPRTAATGRRGRWAVTAELKGGPGPRARPSPPGTASGGAPGVTVLHPRDWGRQVERAQHSPNTTEPAQRAADPGRPLESAASPLHGPRRPLHLRPRQPQPCDQPLLLARPDGDPAAAVVPLDPLRQPAAELALAVVHEDQAVVSHSPKL